MYESLKAKFEKAAEGYTDLLIKRIEAANKDLNAESIVNVDESIRMVAYMATTLERIDRLNRGNETDGLND
ncbi:MAG: hypothetical protein NC401_06455 [Ruminococcus sp.]|nr:hypothetical protein [Ruminococcus sp.]